MNHANPKNLDVVIVGGGMITHDQILPSIYHLQRRGAIGGIKVCALNSAPLRELAEEMKFDTAFPGQGFEACPSLDTDPGKMHPNLYKDVVASMPTHNLVVVAVPDHFHYNVIMTALKAEQHVLTVKPLVLKHEQAQEIEKLAHDKGLFVGVEYHKRFDRRSLDARGQYRSGKFGEFKCGEARLIEPWFYRHSNFQNWFTCENTDPFTYIGCHYVDLVYYITGLRPIGVSLQGVKGTFPNGKEGYMWSAARVQFENGGLLNVANGLGYPDTGAGTNDQGICLYGEGNDCGTILKHNDQFRGVSQGYDHNAIGANVVVFRFINPDYMRLVPWEDEGLKPVGYGYDSIEANVMSAVRVNTASNAVSQGVALSTRQQLLKQIDDRGIIATPANSAINELVMEAGRLSILNDGAYAKIIYGEHPGVSLM
jgi:D-galacturonate reductase